MQFVQNGVPRSAWQGKGFNNFFLFNRETMYYSQLNGCQGSSLMRRGMGYIGRKTTDCGFNHNFFPVSGFQGQS